MSKEKNVKITDGDNNFNWLDNRYVLPFKLEINKVVREFLDLEYKEEFLLQGENGKELECQFLEGLLICWDREKKKFVETDAYDAIVSKNGFLKYMDYSDSLWVVKSNKRLANEWKVVDTESLFPEELEEALRTGLVFRTKEEAMKEMRVKNWLTIK